MHLTFYVVLICFLAGMGAGLGTGFAGMSAAVVISPLLITFLGFPAYQAIGIALASDVLASAVSAYTYRKYGNLDIKHASIMMAFVLFFTVVGSIAAKFVPNTTLGDLTLFCMSLLGLKFLFFPVTENRRAPETVSRKRYIIQSAACGFYIGFVSGFLGAGGGLIMLFALTCVLGYETKYAVGTSVFIMAFTALTGAVSHFMIGGAPDMLCLVLCSVFTLIWARIASGIANRISSKAMNRCTGVILVLLGAVVFTVRYF